MVDADILRRRVDALLNYLSRLDRFASIDRESFVADPDTHQLAERYLHLAVESALDIANHIIADRGYEAPETYRDAFSILARHGLLTDDLANRLQGWLASGTCSFTPTSTLITELLGTPSRATWMICGHSQS